MFGLDANDLGRSLKALYQRSSCGAQRQRTCASAARDMSRERSDGSYDAPKSTLRTEVV